MKPAEHEPPIASTILFITAGPILWAFHFLLVYGSQSALCAVGGQGAGNTMETIATGWVIAATLAIAPPLAVFLWKPALIATLLRFRAEEAEQAFAFRVFRVVSFLSLVGVLFACAASLIIAPCAQLR